MAPGRPSANALPSALHPASHARAIPDGRTLDDRGLQIGWPWIPVWPRLDLIRLPPPLSAHRTPINNEGLVTRPRVSCSSFSVERSEDFKRSRDWTIRQRILASFLAIIAAMVVMGAFANTQLERIDRQARATRTDTLPGLSYSSQLLARWNKNYRSVKRWSLQDDGAEFDSRNSANPVKSRKNSRPICEIYFNRYR